MQNDVWWCVEPNPNSSSEMWQIKISNGHQNPRRYKHLFMMKKITSGIILAMNSANCDTSSHWPSTYPCWRHQMKTFSALLAICAGNSPVPGEFPAERPVTRSFDVFFDLRLNKRLSKQSWGWWFETLPRPLWRHCNARMISDRCPLKYANRCILSFDFVN